MCNSFSRFCHLKNLPSGLYIVGRKKLHKSPLLGKKKLENLVRNYTGNAVLQKHESICPTSKCVNF